MKAKLNYRWFFTGLISFIVILFIAFQHFESKEIIMEKIHILKAPLSIGSEKDNNYYLLPKGAYLYFDTVFPEGFTRYRLYVNIKDNLELRDNIERVEAPLSAHSITKDRLLNLLANVKLDKDDIKTILENGEFSDSDKKEIAELLNK